MNPVETAVPDEKVELKPMPVWLKIGAPIVLLLLGFMVYVFTRGGGSQPALNIDPPGGVAANAAVDKTVDKSVDKTRGSTADSPSANGLALLPIGSATAATSPVSNPSTLVANGSNQPMNAIAPVVTTSSTLPADTGQQLNRLSEQLGQLQLLVNQLSDVSGQLNQRIAQLDERLPKAAVKQVSAAQMPRRSFVKPALTVPAPVAVNALPADVPMLVAVDSWDGRPSVSIRTSRGIVFASEGDQVEGWQLVSTNARAQRAEFYRPANGNVTVGAQPVLATAP
jgi:TolA-binding protein